MKEVILLLYFRDEKYGKRLLRFLAGKKNPFLHPELVTAKERIDRRIASEEERLVVLTDYAGMEENSRRKVIYLSGEGGRSENKIFRYQKASGIYRDMMEILELRGPEKEPEKRKAEKKTERGMFCLLDPEGAATPLAVLLSQYLGKRGKCLYLNLTGFPLYYGDRLQEEPDFHTKGLAEIFFHMDGERFADQIGELAVPFGCAYMLPPFPHFKDLLDCRAQEWTALLKRLRTEAGYDSIVIEAGQLFEYILEVMEQSEYPCLMERPGSCGRIRSAVFRQYCRLEQKEVLLRTCRITNAPFSKEEGFELLSRYGPQELAEEKTWMDKIGNWLMTLEKEVESDCIFEEDG